VDVIFMERMSVGGRSRRASKGIAQTAVFTGDD
jgi:hypothetical protein